MTAFSKNQAQKFIVDCRLLSAEFSTFVGKVQELINDEKNVNQNFNQLDTDFPSMFVVGPDPVEEPDAVSSAPLGAPWPDPPTQTNPLLEGTVEQSYSAADVKKFLDSIDEFKQMFIDNTSITCSANLGKELRQLSL